VALLFATRAVRLFAYGALSVILLSRPELTGGRFVAARLLKLVHDDLLDRPFRDVIPPEAAARSADRTAASV
jgi:hypothetical protein